MDSFFNLSNQVTRRINKRDIFKVLLSLIIYAVLGCVIADEKELHNQRTNEIPYMFVEYGDYIFVCACSFWLSLHHTSIMKSNSVCKFVYELWTSIIMTNIALKIIWIQLIEFTSIICTATSYLMAELYKFIIIDLIQTASDLLKTETCGRLVLTLISTLLLTYVLQSVDLIGFIKCLIKIQPCNPSCSDSISNSRLLIASRRNLRGVPKRRRRSQISDDSDDGYDSQYIEPVNRPILSDF